MPNQPDRHLRSMVPIPDVVMPGMTTYDAKDPDTKFPPLELVCQGW
jgi:arylsulfatase